MAVVIKIRRGTTSQWSSSTRVLQQGELGLDSTLNKLKVGNGSSLWSALPFINVLPSELNESIQDVVYASLDHDFHENIVVTYNDEDGNIILSTGPDVITASSLSDTLTDPSSGYVSIGDVGNPDGVATLDSSGFVPDSEISSSIARSADIISSYNDLSDKPTIITDYEDLTSLPDLSVYATINNPTFTGSVTLAGDPTSDLHAATKSYVDTYVDNIATGIVAKPAVLGATTANIDATYYNGPDDDGVEATLTSNENGVFPETFAGATGWSVGKGILVKNQTDKAENGRYFVSDMGSVSTPYVLTRCGYCDEANEIPGAYIFVQDGTNEGTGWIQVVDNPTTFTVGTDDIYVYQFSGSGTYTAGNGLSLNGTVYSIDTATTVDLSTEQTLTNKTLTSPEITAPTGITKTDVGLSNVDNTSDESKYENEYVSISSTSLTLSSTSHKFKVVEFNSNSPISVTIPNDTQDSGWQVGSYVEVRQIGSGQITVGKDAAVTYNAPDSQYKSRVQWSSLFIEKRAANNWLITGDATA